MNRNGNEAESFADNFVASDESLLFFEVPYRPSAINGLFRCSPIILHPFARAREVMTASHYQTRSHLPAFTGARNARRARVYARHARKTPTRRGGRGKALTILSR